jgi:hypothetical protein
MLGLSPKHLIGQIVKHIGMAAGEVSQKCRDLCGVLLLKREGGQL